MASLDSSRYGVRQRRFRVTSKKPGQEGPNRVKVHGCPPSEADCHLLYVREGRLLTHGTQVFFANLAWYGLPTVVGEPSAHCHLCMGDTAARGADRRGSWRTLGRSARSRSRRGCARCARRPGSARSNSHIRLGSAVIMSSYLNGASARGSTLACPPSTGSRMRLAAGSRTCSRTTPFSSPARRVGSVFVGGLRYI